MSETQQPNYSILLLALIILIGFAIYWFGMRPEQLRADCRVEADKTVDEFALKYSSIKYVNPQDMIQKTSQWRAAANTNCLKNHGLN